MSKNPLQNSPSPKSPPFRIRCLVCCALTLSPHPAAAGPPAETNFGDLSLEELMNETVTSVSKKEERLSDAPAAISVLTNDDLRRSGATSISDTLRLVPGMDVGSISSSQTAVSARGFNGLYANKLLVLVDGRAVYTPLFGGVYWDQQQLMLEDVDRIEVIRGPGATVWGANAVNGVVNVVTRSARDTQGGLLYGGGGDVQQTLAGARQGGRIGERTYFRVYATEQSRENYSTSDGRSVRDGWWSRHGGVRVDHYTPSDAQLTWQAMATAADLDEGVSDAYNVNTLGRWHRDWSDRSGAEAQIYFDRTYRNDAVRERNTIDTLDLTFQRRFALGERQDLVGGLGYRFIQTSVEQNNPRVLIRDGDIGLRLFSAFIQDEITLVPDRLTLTLGAKVEHNDFTGLEFQPSVRAVFKPEEKQTLWGAVSRAVRTPSILEGRETLVPIIGPPFPGPGGLYVPIVTGNPEIDAEVLLACELGWRMRPTPRVSVDVAVFYNDYDELITTSDIPVLTPGTPIGTAEMRFVNGFEGHTYGGETSVSFSPSDSWRLTLAYSLLLTRINATRNDAEEIEARPPIHQVSLRSSYDFTKRLSLDGQARYVDSLPQVPSYITLDLHLSYRPNERLELSVTGQNLLDSRHPEQATPLGPPILVGEVPRSFYGKIAWKF